MTREIVSIEIEHGKLGDGVGGEVDATVVRLWADGLNDGDRVVVAEVKVDQRRPSELDGLAGLLQAYLDGFGIGDSP